MLFKKLILALFLASTWAAVSHASNIQNHSSNQRPNKQVTNTTTMQNKTIELIHGQGEIDHAIIWLHGLGASANDFPPIVPELGLNDSRSIRFIFPQAPDRPITVNGGMLMPGWYDIRGMDIADKQDAQGMAQSQSILESLIEQQIELGVPSKNIIIAGFSQGGAVVYHTGVRSNRKLAGMLTLSTYLPFSENVATEQSNININTPILANHGTHDPMVPMSFGQSSVETLSQLGYSVSWKTYAMEHQVVLEQIQDIGEWINQTFSESID